VALLLEGKMNIISAFFGLVANTPWNPSYSSLIHNLNKVAELIILNIPLLLLTSQNWPIHRMKTTPYLNKDCRDDKMQEMHFFCSTKDSMNKGT